MKYHFKSEVKASDFWKLSMYKTYHNIAGICNIVFTVAMIALLLHFWNRASDLGIGLIVFGCLLFPVIQPVCVYLRSQKQAEEIPKDLELAFDDSGIYVTTGGAEEKIRWNKVGNIIKQRDMLVIYTDDRHGYILMQRTLGDLSEEFLAYLKKQTKRM